MNKYPKKPVAVEVKTNVIEYPKDERLIEVLDGFLKDAHEGEIISLGLAAVMKDKSIKTYHNSENDIFGLLGAVEVVKARILKDSVDLE